MGETFPVLGGPGPMLMVLNVSIMITAAQLMGAYLRYLPFREELSEEEIRSLGKRMILWSLFAIGYMLVFLEARGIDLSTFKAAMILGWIPYFILSMTVIRNRFAKHVFAMGMQALWSFMLHVVTGIIVKTALGGITVEYVGWHLLCYLTFLTVLLPFEKKYFGNLFPTENLLDDRILRWCIAILPFSIFLGALLPIVRITFLPTWVARLGRIAIPLFFFFVYRTMSISTRETSERLKQEHANNLMQQQLTELRKMTLLMQESNERIAVMRHDLRHSYRMIYALLQNGEKEKALEHIRGQQELLRKDSEG